MRPLMVYSHRRYPRSLEDVRDALEAASAWLIWSPAPAPSVGSRTSTVRGCFFYRWHRASLILFPKRLRWLGHAPAIARPLIHLDKRVARYRIVREHLVRLVWGFSSRNGANRPRPPGGARVTFATPRRPEPR